VSKLLVGEAQTYQLAGTYSIEASSKDGEDEKNNRTKCSYSRLWLLQNNGSNSLLIIIVRCT
jgi:hypothetical protein